MGDIEKARREIRYAKSAADDRRWDLLQTRLSGIEGALEGVSDAEKASVLAEIAPLRDAMTKALREEQATRIEREIRRNLSNAEEGSEAQLEKAVFRLQQPDAQECLSAETIERLQQEIAAIGKKLGVAVAAPTAPAPAPAPATAPAPAASLSDEGRAIESDVGRLLRFAEEDIERDADRAGERIERAFARLDSDEGKRHLPAEVLERLKAQVAALQSRIAAGRQAEAIARIDDQIGRFTLQCKLDFERGHHTAWEMLRKATERTESADARRLLPRATIERRRAEIEQLRKQMTEARRKGALERALAILAGLEQRAAGRIFDGGQPAYRALGDLDYEKSRVRGALEHIGQDDDEVRAIEARLARVDERIAEACAALDADQARGRIAEAWRLDAEAIAGWDEEQQPGGEDAVSLPKCALAVHRLAHFLADPELARIRSAHAADAEIQSIFEEAARIRAAAAEKLAAAFDAVLAALENGPRPSNRVALEAPARLAAAARDILGGTKFAEQSAARATRLDERWQAEIAADRAAREARYRELSAVADAAWPAIVATIRAEDSFDPLDSGARGKTVRLDGIRNRIGWDFSGPYDFAIWVDDTPVVGNYHAHLSAAVNAACERTGLPLDDHTDWDAVFVVGAPGKIKQRFRVLVRDRNLRELGTIEEWRPVDCVMCSVIALRAGPVAAAAQR